MRFHGTVLFCVVAIATMSAGCCKDEDKTEAPAPAPIQTATATATATTTTKTPQPVTTLRFDAGVYRPDAGSVFGGPPSIATSKHTTGTPPTKPPTTQPPPTSTTFGTPPGLR